MEIIELKLKQDKNAIFDLELDNNGELVLDESLDTSISISLFTDTYVASFPVGKRRGGIGINWGNNAWTRLSHNRVASEDLDSFLNNAYNNSLNRDFTNAGVWDFSNINVNYLFGSLQININMQKKTGEKNKYSYNYSISGK